MCFKKGRAYRQAGFSLIELLIVMSIIALLIGFLAPRLLGMQDRGKETAVRSTMHSIQLALEAYNMENETYPVVKNLDLESLCTNYLSAGSYVPGVPKNPFTGKTYTAKDSAGKIIYSFDDASGKYTLIGYKRDGKTKIMELSNN